MQENELELNPGLSRQEEKVLLLSMRGLSDKEIASRLNLGVNTIRTYWERIRRKVGGSTRAEIVANSLLKQDDSLEATRVENELLLKEIVLRRRAETRLEQKERFLNAILDSSPLGIFVTDSEGDPIYNNPAFFEITGLPNEAMAGKARVQILHPEDRERVMNTWSESFKTQRSYESQHRYVRPNGRVVHVHSWANPLIEEGEFVGYVGLIEDVTEKVAQAELVRSIDAKYQMLCNSIPHMVWRSDSQKRLLECNPQTLEYTGKSFQELSEHSWRSLVHPEDEEPAFRKWMAAAEAGTTYQARIRIQRRDGVYRWHLSRANPVRNQAGEIVEWVGTCTDIDELEGVAQKRKGKVAS